MTVTLRLPGRAPNHLRAAAPELVAAAAITALAQHTVNRLTEKGLLRQSALVIPHAQQSGTDGLPEGVGGAAEHHVVLAWWDGAAPLCIRASSQFSSRSCLFANVRTTPQTLVVTSGSTPHGCSRMSLRGA